VVEQINGWVSDETNEMIKEVVNESAFSDDTIMCLINAIYFLGNWTVPFHPDETIETLFLNDDSTQTQIDMMVKYDDVEVARGSDYTVVRLPYGEEKVGMYCILPSEGTYIDTFIQTLTLDKFNDMKNRLVLREDFYIGLPKFKMEYGVKSIKKQLSDMGMNKMFTTSAEFPGITDESVLVSDVLHKAEIEVNEEGTEAAAVTVFIIEATSEGENTFYADRPFVFMIVDDTTESILFMGKTADLVK
jgi:serine protease inhibitor